MSNETTSQDLNVQKRVDGRFLYISVAPDKMVRQKDKSFSQVRVICSLGRSSTRQLKASGNVLTNLVGSLDGRLYSNVVWRFTLNPQMVPERPTQENQHEGQDAPDSAPELPELPYNRCTLPHNCNTSLSNSAGIVVFLSRALGHADPQWVPVVCALASGRGRRICVS